MAKNWMAKAFAGAHGQLRSTLHKKKGQSITQSEAAVASKKPGVTGKRARLVATAMKINRRKK